VSRKYEIEMLLRFLCVGGGIALGYSLTVAALTSYAGAPVYVTAIALYAFCIPLAFVAQKRVTFRVRQTRTAGFPIYVATQVASLALVAWITTRVVTGAFLPDTLIFLGTAGSAALLSFFVSRSFAFRPPASGGRQSAACDRTPD
jgi:putative flippase GtrA